jgi:hypothetical protein
MKKALIYFCLLKFFTMPIFSQDLPLVVDTTLEWSVLYGEYYPVNTYERTEYFKIEGDSTINEINYKKVYNSRYPLYNWYFDDCFIREDTQRVYLLDEYNQEKIIYDFSLDVGDTIRLQNMFNQENDWIVYEIDSIEIEGIFRKQIHLGLDGYCCDDKWIEGIGSILGLTTSGNIVYDFATQLLCAKRDSQIIYSNPDYDTCYIYYVYEFNGIRDVNTQTNKQLFKLSQNPVFNELLIYSDLEIYEYQLFDISGRLINSGQLHKNSIIDINKLTKGFYIMVLYTKKNRIIAKMIKE